MFLGVHVLSVSRFHNSIIELVTDSKRECRMEVLLVVLSVYGGDPARGWSCGHSFSILSYGWEELILHVSFWHYIQVDGSNLPYTCLCFSYRCRNFWCIFWGCCIMVSEPRLEQSTLRDLHMCSESMRFIYEYVVYHDAELLS